MAAHRYWRAVGLEAYGAGDLELSAFHLLAAGARVDASATLTATAAPDVSGALANLQDDVLSTAARWSARAVKALVLSWDFGGSPAAVDDIRLAGDSNTRFLLITKVQWSDNASAWTDLATYAGITWPGAGVKTASVSNAITLNLVKGRSASSDPITLGAGPVITYGAAQIGPPIYFGVDTGSVRDYLTGQLGQGVGRVRGTVMVQGSPNVPVFRKVRLIRERDGIVMREQWSNKTTGAYDFKYIDELQAFTVVSFDYLHNNRAVIADNITLAGGGVEIMP